MYVISTDGAISLPNGVTASYTVNGQAVRVEVLSNTSFLYSARTWSMANNLMPTSCSPATQVNCAS